MEEFCINLRNCCGIQNPDIPLTCLSACYPDDISVKYRNRVEFVPLRMQADVEIPQSRGVDNCPLPTRAPGRLEFRPPASFDRGLFQIFRGNVIQITFADRDGA